RKSHREKGLGSIAFFWTNMRFFGQTATSGAAICALMSTRPNSVPATLHVAENAAAIRVTDRPPSRIAPGIVVEVSRAPLLGRMDRGRNVVVSRVRLPPRRRQ